MIETATGRPLGPALKGHTRIANMAMSGDGKTVALADLVRNAPGAVTILVTCWDVATGKSLGEPIQYSTIIEEFGRPLALSPDGKTLLISDEALGTADYTVRRWDVASGKEVGTALKSERRIWGVAYSPDGRMFAAGLEDSIRIWDATTGQPIGNELKPCGGREFAFSPDSKRLLAAGPGRAAHLWDIASSKEIGRFELSDGDIGCVAFSPDGRRIITDSGVVRLWDVATQKPLGPPMAHPGGIHSLAFRHGDQAIVAALQGATIEAWDRAGTGAKELAWNTGFHPDPRVTIPMAFASDGQTLLTAGGWNAESDAKYWNARTGELKATLTPQHEAHRESYVVSVAVSPDGKTGLTACYSHGPASSFDIGAMHFVNFTPIGEVVRWDLAKGTNLGPLAEIHEELMYARYVRGGQAVLLVSAPDLNSPTTLRLFDAVTGKAIGAPIALGGHRVEPVAVSPDGRRAVSGQGFGQPPAQLWDATTGQPIGPPLVDAGQVTAVAFSPSGELFATATGNMARLWYTATGKQLGGPIVHKGSIGGVEFSPDSKTLLTSCSLPDHTGQVDFWDVPSGQAVLPPRVFAHAVDAFTMLPDGKSVAAVSDGEMRIWPVPLPATEEIDRLRRRFQVWTGMELRDVVGYQALDPETWLKRKQELEAAE